MKKLYTCVALMGVVTFVSPAWATGVPVWGHGEVTTQMVDNTQSNAASDIFQTEHSLVESKLKGVKGMYSPGAVKNALCKSKDKCALRPTSEAITGQYEGLENILGKNSPYGQIKVKKCGANIPSVVERVKEALTLPAAQSDREKLTTAEITKRDNNRNESIESAATTALAKAWIVETEAADIAEAISDTQKELDKATSQMMVMVTILRLQEETQKNVNTRLSLMGDELISTGLTALDSGL